jgi:hypothetical protein
LIALVYTPFVNESGHFCDFVTNNEPGTTITSASLHKTGRSGALATAHRLVQSDGDDQAL